MGFVSESGLDSKGLHFLEFMSFDSKDLVGELVSSSTRQPVLTLVDEDELKPFDVDGKTHH